VSFKDFQGNAETVTRLREMLQRDRFPHAVILSGPAGSGKYTLAQMLTKAMNCLDPQVASDGLPDYCGVCANCTRIAQADDLEARCEEANEARENLRETDKKETRLFIQTHSDVLVVPPDPPQLMIKVDQVRRVTETIYYRPVEGKRRVYIFTNSAFMKEAANALLKVLEEPPEFATIFLLTSNPGELLATIRSRSITFRLAPLPAKEVEAYLATERRELAPQQRALVARLSGGALGRAKRFDVAIYMQARTDALTLLRSSLGAEDHSCLFRTTEGYRAGADGRPKTDLLVRTLYGLLEDVTYLRSGTPELVANTDIAPELKRLAEQVTFEWIEAAARELAGFESGMRRNLLRSLALDSMVVGLER
jgi:DNA polymerase III subunit delta'